jgi:polysaccharide export outer membrane protein
MLRITFYLFFCFILLTLSSCKLREKMVYFNSLASDTIEVTENKSFDVKLKVDDFLSIIVSDLDEESTAQFNLKSSVTSLTGYSNGTNILDGYLINSEGVINLPVLGKTKVAGLSKSELIELLEIKLKEYLKSPVVNVSILNYKITVLGEVNMPGTYRIPNDRITILEAIGLAGDLKITGIRKNVLVIREIDGIKTKYRVDLTKSNLFNSPVYYLHQNDVVYVEPNIASLANSTFVKSNGTLFISITSLVLSTLILISK